jgi:hypothetical protein
VDQSKLEGITAAMAFTYADALVALRSKLGITREQAHALTLAYATSESHELGYSEAEHREMANECIEEEWATPNSDALKAREVAPAIREEQQLRSLVGAIGPLVPPSQGWMAFVYTYGGNVNEGNRAAYVGSIARPEAAQILAGVLDYWQVRDEQLNEPTHRTVNLLRMMVPDIGEHETVGADPHPNQRTTAGAGEAAIHLEAAAQHLAIYRQLGLQAIRAGKAKAQREAH